MEFTLTSPSVNCVKQSSCLNDQGGISVESVGENGYRTYPIAFKSKCFYINAISILSNFNVGAWGKVVDKSKFLCGLANDYSSDGITPAVRYIAIGL